MGKVLSARQMLGKTQTMKDQKQRLDANSSHDKAPTSPKRPQGRPPAGAVLVDGKWQLTQRSAVERLLRHREHNRVRREETREMLRGECPELFAHLPAPAEVPAETPRSHESQGTLWQYQKKD